MLQDFCLRRLSIRLGLPQEGYPPFDTVYPLVGRMALHLTRNLVDRNERVVAAKQTT